MPPETKVVESVKDEEEINLDYGFYPDERPPDVHVKFGVINLDKTPGPTSHQVSSWVKKIAQVSKAGHGGTLDPMVSGVLLIGLERATNALTYVIHSDKEYVGVARLQGQVSQDELGKVVALFQGRIYQRPPQKSAVRRKLRTRFIHSFNVLEVDERDVLFHIKCESGFYVRKLVHDVGLLLGVGAHLWELRRVRSGPFMEDETLVDLYRVKDAFHRWRQEGDFTLVKRVVQPMESVFRDFPRIVVRDSAVGALCHGAKLYAPGVLRVTSNVKKGVETAILTQKGEVVAVARPLMDYEGVLEASRGVVASLERVLMSRDTYPKMWC
ncbi:MAG: RNA-guided pseudouridylation complex pseudouridine synthase subunit Cbf5 [Candidatus Geothermarchaeales archaeon]